MSATTAPALLTATETATVLRCSTRSVYRMAADGSIPSVRIRRALRFPAAAIHALTHGGPQ